MRLTLLSFFSNCRSIFCVKIVQGHLAQNGTGQFSHSFIFVRQIWSKCPNKFGRARPGPAGSGLTKGLRMRIGADLHENRLFIEKRCFRPIFIIFGPSRPQKWIRLEILRWKMVSGGLETQNSAISCKICDLSCMKIVRLNFA